MTSNQLPFGLIAYGPNANCTLQLCPVEWSVIGYRPWRAANGTFIGLFGLAMVVHILAGFRWRTWGFTICMVLGCIDEILGYLARVMLYFNPFSFTGFLMEISVFCLQAFQYGYTQSDLISLYHYSTCFLLRWYIHDAG